MSTVQNLIQEFGTQFPTVQTVSDHYFNLAERTVRKQIANNTFPVRIFRSADNRKSPWLVDVNDLAVYLETRKNQSVRTEYV